MTVRVVVAVALAVALLAVAAPGMQGARERAAVSAVEADADRVRAAVAAMAAAPRGSRRVVALSVPAATVGTARVAAVRVTTHAVRYRLASGRRGGRRLPAAVRAVDADRAAGEPDEERSRTVLAFDSPGTYRVVVTATSCGVRVAALERVSDSRTDSAVGDARAPAGEGLNEGTRPASSCSNVVATAGVRRASTGTRSASTRATATATVT